jgi:hypothetical protein
MIAATAVVLVLAVRAAGCHRPDTATEPAAHPVAAPHVLHRPAPWAGEGAERPGGGRFKPAASVTAVARRAVAAYLAFEHRPRSRPARALLGQTFSAAITRQLDADPPHPPVHAVPALRPLVVASEGRRGFTATAITRRGELYLVLWLERIRGRLVVTALG